MKKFTWFIASVATLLAMTSLGPTARAQVTVDMSRMTCADYLALAPEQARMLAAWMSGWFNQKTGYVWVNLQAYNRNVANVTSWCASYPNHLVMDGLHRATQSQ